MATMKKYGMLAAIAAVGFATSAFAATSYQWTGTHNPNVWNDAKNWFPDSGYPGAASGDTAIFDNGSTVTITSGIPSTALAALTVTSSTTVSLSTSVSESIATLTIDSGSQLSTAPGLNITTTSALANSGSLIVAGALVNSGTVANNTGASVTISYVRQLDDFSNMAGEIVVNAACTTSGAFTNGGPMTINASKSFTPGGALTNASGKTITIDGSLILGTFTNSGSVVNNSGGSVTFNSNRAINDFSNMAGSIVINADCTITASFTNNGPMTINSGKSLTTSAVLTNNASKVITVNGSLFLSSNVNNYGGISAVGLVEADAAVTMSGNNTGTLTVANTGTVQAVSGAFTFANDLALADSASAIWKADNAASSASLSFLSSQTLAGDFVLADTSSTFNFDSGVTVSTSGSYSGAYALKCSGITGAGSFVWSGSGGYAPGHCP